MYGHKLFTVFDFSENREVGKLTGGQKAMAEGKSMAISEGRVHTVEYHAIHDAVGEFAHL